MSVLPCASRRLDASAARALSARAALLFGVWRMSGGIGFPGGASATGGIVVNQWRSLAIPDHASTCTETTRAASR
ncbi:hypothetical protein ACFPRL_30805 [Pseudoclavibacter helvolus]